MLYYISLNLLSGQWSGASHGDEPEDDELHDQLDNFTQ